MGIIRKVKAAPEFSLIEFYFDEGSSKIQTQQCFPHILEWGTPVFTPIAFPPFILIFYHLLQITPCYTCGVLPEHHRKGTMLANVIFEYNVDRCSIIRSRCKDLAALTR
ncbi:hypothetical protein WM94_28435 [Pseudomonas sp. ABFPK]|nr:hypothetical protein WM94_28435 [Pseudomonas sp. ABFPK]